MTPGFALAVVLDRVTVAPVERVLEGRVIGVVGGTSGVGLAAARALLAAGARVACLGRDQDSCQAAAGDLGREALVHCGDAAEPGPVETTLGRAVERWARLDGLFHVAGGSGRSRGDGPLHELSEDGWDFTVALNLRSVFLSNRAAVRRFLAQGAGGVVLNLGSVLAGSPAPRHFSTHAYAAAKAGIEGLTRAAAAHYAPQNIRFNLLTPGLVATPMSARAQQNEDIMRYIRTKQPLDGGRIGRPDDLTAAAVFLLSDAARFITGQILAVDGGWSVSEGMPGGGV